MTRAGAALDGATGRRRSKTARFIRDILITLQINDRIVVNALVPRVRSVKRGDVIVFSDSDDSLMNEKAPPTSSSPVVRT